MPVAGEIDDARALDSDWIAKRRPLSVYSDLACSRREAGERAHEFALTVPLDASKTDHFAGHNLEIYALQNAVCDLARN